MAALLPPAGAAGCLWLGLTGGAFPDYVDIRSEARRVMRHRGVSHSFLALGLAWAACLIVLDAVSRSEAAPFELPSLYARAWAACFGLGILSHLMSDACTRGGIQPWLPFSKRRVWLLPSLFRSRSDGWLNGLMRLGAVVLLGICLAIFLLLQVR